MNNKLVGDTGEDLAVKFLEKKGYSILGRNVREKIGEIDIVAKIGGLLVFVEVKSIKNVGAVNPEDNMTYHKKRKLTRTIQLYNMRNKYEGEFRIDLITVKISRNPEITHFEGI